MVYLSISGLSKQFTEKVLFSNISFGLNRGDKVGLIASNGAGKSTLLKIIAGIAEADSGEVVVSEGISMYLLEQEPVFHEDQSIASLLDSGHTEVLVVIQQYEKAVALQSEEYSEESQKLFEEVSDRMDQLDAWDYQRKLVELLDRFRITDLDQKISSLSGGEKKRLAMALALLDSPDLLIMDEPTNHLDVNMIEWLEKYLGQSNITLLMVTHDRYFLDRVCNHILELSDGKMYKHKGNYAYFLEKKTEREENLATEVGKAGQLLKKELEWMRRSPKARTTKSKSRISAFYDLKDKASINTEKKDLQLEVNMSRIGGKILEAEGLSKRFDDTIILDEFTHVFKKGERIGIVGKNGVGKSTFLNMLMGLDTPDSGSVILGQTTVFGYYSQKGLELKEDKRIIDIVRDIAEVITFGDGRSLGVSQFLQHFLFPMNMHGTFFSKLSGGEKRRLYLVTVLIKNPNFLILDEPTNDLDLLTLNRLEEFLESFKGCILLVSHDRYFMDKLVDHLFVFEGDGKVNGFLGSYKEYRQITEEEMRNKMTAQKEAQKPVEQKSTKPVVKKKKLSFKEKNEYEALEKEIMALENEKADLEKDLSSGSLPFDELEQKSHRIGELINLIDGKSLRWMELDDIED